MWVKIGSCPEAWEALDASQGWSLLDRLTDHLSEAFDCNMSLRCSLECGVPRPEQCWMQQTVSSCSALLMECIHSVW